MWALHQGPGGPRCVEKAPMLRAGEARVAVRLAGVCATDLELVKGYMAFEGTLGHEWVGEVLDAPDPAWIGRRVVGDINCACGRCATCLAGRPSHCPNRTVLGIVGRDGAFAEELSLPVGNLHPVPEGVPDEAAVFVEPLAAACEILEQVAVRPSMRVVVLGSGRLGQLCARVLALSGAEVAVVGRNPQTMALLPRGIRRVDSNEAGSVAGADLVVDCTGSPDGLGLASSLVRARGTVVLSVGDDAPVPVI
ncbi:MAG TPA: alcohol dehydrogenase catalytic domain-containing protein, partial [Myxococcota bacterium]|nr:alcohol dehydrogenase catalytic domain-containing protein [Myxococcota bacterium]